ncbi:hypothetical protein [Croceicoccus sp. Ery15]|nr:hypothetical protein [Croceicoccus sp. Ery15]
MPAKKVWKVAQDGVVADGDGGFLAKGDPLPDDADVESLKAKGWAE